MAYRILAICYLLTLICQRRNSSKILRLSEYSVLDNLICGVTEVTFITTCIRHTIVDPLHRNEECPSNFTFYRLTSF